VSQSWFYRGKDGELPPRAARRERLRAEIAWRFAQREGRDGAPRITAALREAGWRVSENTVAGLMRQAGLAARRRKRRKGSTRPGRGRWRAEDLVRRKFAAGGISQRWYGDGTEVKTGEGKLHLDSVLDMASRRIVGLALGPRHDAALACGALAMAVAARGGAVPGVVFHTDQGSEYTAGAFRQACERLGIAQSMGRPGSALDNAVIEPWHSTLEFELRSLRELATRAQARAAVAAWIEDCNTVRRHSALGMRSPAAYEQALKGKDTA
jgi:transposase InsO family protein